jgi:uncharacterized protein YkwD
MPRRALACLFVPVLSTLSIGAGCGDDDGEPTTGAPATGTDATSGATSGASADPGTTDPTTGTGDDPTTGTGGGADDPAWMTPYCYMLADKKWLGPWIDAEQQVFALVNQARAAGADCGSMGKFDPAPALTLEPRLHCAARRHSWDMGERNFYDHVNPEGEGPDARIMQAGYTGWASVGENIAAGSPDPTEIFNGWMASDAHCANIMNLQYKHFGIGFYEGPGDFRYYWTQTFGAPFE